MLQLILLCERFSFNTPILHVSDMFFVLQALNKPKLQHIKDIHSEIDKVKSGDQVKVRQLELPVIEELIEEPPDEESIANLSKNHRLHHHLSSFMKLQLEREDCAQCSDYDVPPHVLNPPLKIHLNKYYDESQPHLSP